MNTIFIPQKNNFRDILKEQNKEIKDVAASIKLTNITDINEKIDKLERFSHGEDVINIHEMIQMFEYLNITFDRMFNTGDLKYNDKLVDFFINKKYKGIDSSSILSRNGIEFDKNMVFDSHEDLFNYYEYSSSYILLLKNHFNYSDEYLANILEVDIDKYKDIENTGLRIDTKIAYKLVKLFNLPLEIILNPHFNLYYILPNNWKTFRKSRGLSALELANILGKSRSNISAVENMNSNLSGRATITALKKLGITFYDIHDVDSLMRKSENVMLKKLLIKKGFKNEGRNNIKLICELLNITYEDMMEYLNFSYHAYKNMESGSQKISTHVMWKLVKKFCLPIEVIINIDYFYNTFCM